MATDRFTLDRLFNSKLVEYDGRDIHLTLTKGEQTTLRIALEAALASHGVKMIYEEIVEAPQDEYPADSHIGTLVTLYRRIDAAYHGRKTWNADYRKQEPHNRVRKSTWLRR